LRRVEERREEEVDQAESASARVEDREGFEVDFGVS